jgi:hypothetical protein
VSEQPPAEPPHAQQQPERGSAKLARARKEHPWAFAGALLGGAGTFLTAVISALALLADDGSQPRAGPTPPPPPVTELEAPYTYASGIDGHGTVTDNERLISVKAPDQWPNRKYNGWFPNDIDGVDGRIGPGLNASPAIDSWREPGSATPGLFFGASRDPRLLALHTPRSVLESVGLAPCAAGAIEENTLGELEGALVEHTCPDSAVRWFSYAWAPRSRDYLVFLQVKLVSERDEGALRRILTTLDVSRFARR